MNHDDPAYLEGLSEADAARATVAVRWFGYRWIASKQHGRFLAHSRMREASPDIPIWIDDDGQFIYYHEIAHNPRAWGASWTGTAFLMDLAEQHGWKLVNMGIAGGEGGRFCAVIRKDTLPEGYGFGPTIHLAVLFACASAAKMEEPER